MTKKKSSIQCHWCEIATLQVMHWVSPQFPWQLTPKLQMICVISWYGRVYYFSFRDKNLHFIVPLLCLWAVNIHHVLEVPITFILWCSHHLSVCLFLCWWLSLTMQWHCLCHSLCHCLCQCLCLYLVVLFVFLVYWMFSCHHGFIWLTGAWTLQCSYCLK